MSPSCPDNRKRGIRRRFSGLRRARIGCAAAALVLTAGCAMTSSGNPPADPNATPRRGGSVTMLLPGEARGLDPYTASAANVADGSRLSALYDVLVWSDPTTGTVRPQMAESLVAGPDPAVWTLTLHPGIVFTDGAQLDSEAVKKAWEMHLNKRLRSVGAAAVAQLELTVVDPLRLRIKLPKPNANFDRIVARNLNFVPSPKTLVSDGALDASAKAPVGAGPYKLREWVPGDHMTFERNPNYWQPGRPYLDTVVFKVNADTTGAAEKIDANEADLTVSTDAMLIDDAHGRGLATGEIPMNGGQMLAFNLDTARHKGPFTNPDLRRAVVLSLNTAEIDRLYYGGKGSPAKGIFDSSSPLANIQLAAPQNDEQRAAALFAAATDNGRKPVEASYVVPRSPRAEAVAQYVRQRVEQVSGGAVRLRVEAEDIPNFIKRTTAESNFDAAVYQLWADDPEPAVYQFLHSQGGYTNVTAYRNPAVDAALDTARQTTDLDLRRSSYTAVQTELNKDLPFFVYQEAVAAYVAAPHVTGLQLFNDGIVLFDRVGLRK